MSAACTLRDPTPLFFNQGLLTKPVLDLLRLDGLIGEGECPTLAEAVEKTQAMWIRVMQGRGGQERTDLVDKLYAPETIGEVVHIVYDMGLLGEHLPAERHYAYGGCLGGFAPQMRNQLAFLVALWRQGYRFDTLVFWTGERRLRSEESLEALCDPTRSPLPFKEGWTVPANVRLETEDDAARLIFDQVELPADMAEALKDCVCFVNGPCPEGQARASTKDVYRHWQTTAVPGSALAVSFPFMWSYQQLAGQNVLCEGFSLDTVAPAVSSQDLDKYKGGIVSIVHDTVAKCLYEISLAEQAKRVYA